MTARAGSETEAANLALAHMRQPPIAQLTDDNSRARAVKATFAAARDAALRLRWWNFATGYASPAQASGAYPGPLKNIFPLPEDWIATRGVEDAQDDEWENVAYMADPAGSSADVMCLVTNKTAPLIHYTRRIEVVRLWDADFLIAFSYQLAAFAGPQLGQSGNKVQELQARANEWRQEAAAIDAREKSTAEVSRATSWVTARRRGGSVVRY